MDYSLVESTKSYKTFAFDFKNNRLTSKIINDLDALKQWIYGVIKTPRYEHIIFSRDYGTELNKLWGKNLSYAMAEIERIITDALLNDQRIKSIPVFDMNTDGISMIVIHMQVESIYGALELEEDIYV